MMKRQLTQTLDLPEVTVKSQKILDSSLILEVEKTDKTAEFKGIKKAGN